MAIAFKGTAEPQHLARRTYYPRPAPVRAVRARERQSWTTEHGDVMAAEPGDMIVSDGENRWSVKADVFSRTYRPVEGADMWTKSAPIQVEIARVETRIQTLEGPQTVPAGYAIVHGVDGELYSMSPERLAERYTS